MTAQEQLDQMASEISEIKKMVADIHKMVPGPHNVPEGIKTAKEVLNSIPKEVLTGLHVVDIGFDGVKPWFCLRREDGTTISVKKQESDFRVRIRGAGGELTKELNPPFNGLVAAITALV